MPSITERCNEIGLPRHTIRPVSSGTVRFWGLCPGVPFSRPKCPS